jgi:hypothetical protein
VSFEDQETGVEVIPRLLCLEFDLLDPAEEFGISPT